ncbi:MAG: DNA-binding domain-containing protein [Paludibacter sp.]|nr:DNA-binding domain-containing protein [Paludibacter sp.]
MKNVLKAWLRKNQLTIDPTEYNTQVVVKGNLGLTDIVDELIKEGIEMDRDTMLDIITRFNRKSADLALSGYNVNNGLVNMRSSIKGPLFGGKWNPNVNWVDVNLTQGKELYDAVAATTVEILGERDEMIESYNLSNQTSEFNGRFHTKVRQAELSEPQLKTAGEPACGIAFRTWLCKA